ncbi:MAG: hypothetical protein ACIAQF_13035 [Phycisphaerales bacterium JB065]
MRAKLCIVILTVTLTAASLLTVRQQRLDAVYDMRRSLESAAALDRQLQEVRIDIARRVTPDSVTQLASAMGPMRPIPAEWSDPILAVLTASNRSPEEDVGSTPILVDRDDPTGLGDGRPDLPDEGRTTLGPAFDDLERAQ